MSDIIQLPVGSTEAAKPGPLTEPQPQQQEQSKEAPQNIPEKFLKDGKLDTEALLKSYTELEKQRSAPKKEEAAPKDEKKTDAKDGEQKPKEEAAAEPTGEELAPYTKEFSETGELSEESIAKAAKQFKLPTQVVKDYVAGLKAQQSAREAAASEAAFNAVGGQDNYTAMSEWARDNLSDAEKGAYNDAIATGDAAKIDLAVSGLYQKFTAAEGRPAATRVRGDRGSSNVTPFRSTDEVTRAMNDPRYATDEAYRAEVADRIAKSDVL